MPAGAIIALYRRPGVEPIGARQVERLRRGAETIGINLGVAQIDQFQIYREKLVEWNSSINLTSAGALEDAETTHFLDSLTVSLGIPSGMLESGRFVDVGSGAGFPGVPLKIAFPGLRPSLVEATAKKTAFLTLLLADLGLSDVEIWTERSETLAQNPRLRESFDFAVVRAVGGVATLAELTLPFCRIGGVAVIQKGPEIGDELDEGRRAIEVVGGFVKEVRQVEVGGPDRTATLLVLEKASPTPPQYPRRPGVPERRPL
jgi:16S rRNA (guanine527-N7)-methyltransferase